MLNLASPPPDFTENPFPHYDALLQNAPVCPQPDGSFIISRHADLNAIYRDTTTYISDKKQAFEPKFGAGSPLFEHHTTSLVFNDPPLHTRARRTAAPGDPETDVLTRLIQGDTQGTLSEIELIQNCIFILNAGHETTTNLIGSGLALLHDHPLEKAKLIADSSLINSTVEEVLRMASPNQFGNRETTTEVTLGTHTIPAGTNLHLCIGAANRDPEVFDNPPQFDIARTSNRHLAFAGGPHVCVGLTLARMEGRIAIQRFLTRYPDYKITHNRKSGGRIRFHGYASLPATLT